MFNPLGVVYTYYTILSTKYPYGSTFIIALQHGVPIVVREYGEKTYEFSQSFIIVTIPFDRTEFESQYIHQNSLDIIKELIENNPQVTLKELANAIGKAVKTVQRLLKDNPKIHYVESSKSGHWEIEEKNLNFILDMG